MKEIKLLDNSMINKIAAGEVVERPASIIKELVENSIDADAKNITVEIKDGGLSYIRVTDNGTGIEKKYVKIAFLRHATSKIENMDDLINVLTLGFRGEALSSIVSVSQVELITKTDNDELGIRIEVHGGKFISEQNIASTSGTTIVVRNIFFNVPARRKFLKKAATESGYISDVLNRFSLAHPEIAFKYINNGTILLDTNGNGDLKTTILQVYGKEVVKKIIHVNNKNDFSIEGYLGKPEISRGNRKYQNIFINGRYIKSNLIESAVEEAYKTKLPIGKFPLYVLNLEIEPNKIDVNVHPTKLEVRFSEEEYIYKTVFNTVSSALSINNLIPEINFNKEKKTFSEITDSVPYIIEETQNDLVTFSQGLTVAENKELDIDNKKPAYKTDLLKKISDIPYQKEKINLLKETQEEIKKDVKEEIKPKDILKNYNIIGQIFKTYWIVEVDGSIYIIDQHSAHERILYEELTNKLKTNSIDSQRLLEPILLKVTQSEINTINDNIELLENFGFEVEEFVVNVFAVRSVPYIFKYPEKSAFFTDIIDKLASIDTSIKNIIDVKINNIAAISCKAAVKGNNKLSYQEARSLIEQLLKIENPFTCPHGRPTIIQMTKYELEKKFKRI